MYRMPENNQEVKRFWTALEVVFFQYANHLLNHLLRLTYFPSNWNILTFFYHFSICFVSFYIILCKLSSFMRIYAFKRKKTSRKRCVYNHGNLYLFRFTYAYMQITVHPPDFAGDKNVDFEFPDDCLFGHPFYFGYHDFISWVSNFLFQRFNAGKWLR